MSNRKNISSGAPWEDVVGYSRAVVSGNMVFISGTASVDEKGNVAGRNIYDQTQFILQKIGKVLKQVDATFEQVVRTRIFTTDISKWEDIARAHGEVFKFIRPATSLVEVKALIHPDMLVEIEADAVID